MDTCSPEEFLFYEPAEFNRVNGNNPWIFPLCFTISKRCRGFPQSS